MFFTSITNFPRNIVSISLLTIVLFCQRDEAKYQDDTTLNKVDFLEHFQRESLKSNIHFGFSKYKLLRLQQSTNDYRQL